MFDRVLNVVLRLLVAMIENWPFSTAKYGCVGAMFLQQKTVLRKVPSASRLADSNLYLRISFAVGCFSYSRSYNNHLLVYFSILFSFSSLKINSRLVIKNLNLGNSIYTQLKNRNKKIIASSSTFPAAWINIWLTFTCSKSTIQTLDKGVKYVQT